MDEKTQRPRRRPRRFTLPDPVDERTSEAIEEFIAGTPRRRAHRRIPVSPGAPPAPARSPRTDPWSGLDSRVDWEDALRREEARVARYGRPATIVVLEFAPAGASLGLARRAIGARLARGVAAVLREQARDSDRVARVGDARFHVLLPETTEREAGRYLDRVHASLASLTETVGATQLRAGVAGARPGDGLAGALERATIALAVRPVERHSQRPIRADGRTGEQPREPDLDRSSQPPGRTARPA